MQENLHNTKNKNQQSLAVLPDIPQKRYFSIGEVSELCLVKPHVLRYWEQEFQQLKPSKRRGNRRYYQYKDLITIRKIRNLLYVQGFTISGARHQLVQDKKSVTKTPVNAKELIASIITELEALDELLETS